MGSSRVENVKITWRKSHRTRERNSRRSKLATAWQFYQIRKKKFSAPRVCKLYSLTSSGLEHSLPKSGISGSYEKLPTLAKRHPLTPGFQFLTWEWSQLLHFLYGKDEVLYTGEPCLDTCHSDGGC